MGYIVIGLTVGAALGSALVAGFFFAFSVVVMRALEGASPSNGIGVMQEINIVVLNPWFFAAFFGTALVCLVLAVYAVTVWPPGAAKYLLAAGILYLVGVIVVTVAVNVPLNDALAAVDAGSGEGRALWARYLSVWTAWNHVRTVAPLLAAAGFVAALLVRPD